VSGSCEDHLAAATRRPRPRASPVQHHLLHLSVRRVLLHALGRGWGGVLAARGPLLGRAEYAQSTGRPSRLPRAPLRSDAGRRRRGEQFKLAHGVRARRGGAGGGGRRAALFVQEGDENDGLRAPRWCPATSGGYCRSCRCADRGWSKGIAA